MFCQNCGEKLEMENQRFCQNCGSEILEIPEKTHITPWMDQNKTTTSSIPVPQYPTRFKKGGEPGSYSKRCLGFGIVSLIIGVITFNIGSSFAMYLYYITAQRVFLGLTIVHVVGIIFGIISIVNSGKAKALEPESSILKAGIALGMIGLVINSILMVVAIVLIY